MSMSHIWQNAERENAELRAELATLRARVAELEAGHVADERSIARLVDERNRAEQLVSDQRDVLLTQKRDRDAALATLERVREALTHGDGPAIDTLARIEAALR